MSAFAGLLRAESKLYLRDLPAAVSTLVLPVALVVGFGMIPGFGDPNKDLSGQSGTQLVAACALAVVIAVTGLAFLPSALATYRERGVLRRLATTPAGPGRLLLAQLAVVGAVLVASLVLVLATAHLGYGVPLPRQFAGFLAVLVLGAAAMCAVGLFIAAVAPSGRAANGIGMGLFFPSMFLGGVYLPREEFPPVLRHLSDATPLGSALQALRDTWSGAAPHPLHLAIMAGYAVVAGVAAARLFRWE